MSDDIEGPIRREVEARQIALRPRAEWHTETGRRRSVPMFEISIENRFLGASRVLRSRDQGDLLYRARAQREKWNDQEIRQRVNQARANAHERAVAEAEEGTRRAEEQIEALRGILRATLGVNDRLDWASLLDKRTFRPFLFDQAPEEPNKRPPRLPQPSFWEIILPPLKRWRLEKTSALIAQAKTDDDRLRKQWQMALQDWKRRRHEAAARYDAKRKVFLDQQKRHNASITDFNARFERSESNAIEEYVRMVFERSAYPEGFLREYQPKYDAATRTLHVTLALPPPRAISAVAGYEVARGSDAVSPIEMDEGDHAALYDEAVKQTVLRTAHEVFEADYTGHIDAVCINGCVTDVSNATGKDETTCIISLYASRSDFEKLDLSRVEPTACLERLKCAMGECLADMEPVRPAMEAGRVGGRSVEGAIAVASGRSDAVSLAEMKEVEFESLVVDLYVKIICDEGEDIVVTRIRRDDGAYVVLTVDDPVKGGKHLLRVKQSRDRISVRTVRDLHQAALDQGAMKGVFVTTSSFARDAREFAMNKPLSLIDGPNLIFLLEERGQSFRLGQDDS